MNGEARTDHAVAFLGLGRMGRPMAANLVAAGAQVTVWNRTSSTATDFAAEQRELGHDVIVAPTPAAAIGDADAVITMLADDQALLNVYDDTVLASLRSGTLAIDMSTVAPTTVHELRRRLGRGQVSFVDAPVSGSVPAATAATLLIMAAGDAEAVQRATPILSVLGRRIVNMGDSGLGASMKLAVNSVVHSLNQAVSEALVLAERAGITRTRAYEVLADSAVAAPFVLYKRPAFEDPGGMPVGFRMDLAAKDLRLALKMADDVAASLPQTSTALTVLQDAVSKGFADRDESAVAQYLRER